MLKKLNHFRIVPLRIERICSTLLTIGSLEFEVVSDTNQLNTIFGELAFQVLPIVTTLFIILFIVDGPHNVSSREPPLAVFLVPDGSHLSIVEKPDGLFGSPVKSCVSNKTKPLKPFCSGRDDVSDAVSAGLVL